MIPLSRSLVPLSPARRAAMQAIAFVENRHERNVYCADYPYAHAFFRLLRGSRRVTLKEIRFFRPSMLEAEFRGNRQSWLAAIDRMIASAGEDCPHPLSSYDVHDLFPGWRFQGTERQRRKTELRDEKYSRQYRREREEKTRIHQAVKGQAEIDLAFHTPASVSSWISRWSDSQLHHTELEIMFYRWSERFPSLKSLERWEMAGQPLWRLGAEAGFLSEESTAMTQELERWMVPNKLMFRAVAV